MSVEAVSPRESAAADELSASWLLPSAESPLLPQAASEKKRAAVTRKYTVLFIVMTPKLYYIMIFNLISYCNIQRPLLSIYNLLQNEGGSDMKSEPLKIKRRGEDGNKVITIRIKEDTLAALDRLAQESNYSRNELINIILKHGIENIEIEQ